MKIVNYVISKSDNWSLDGICLYIYPETVDSDGRRSKGDSGVNSSGETSQFFGDLDDYCRHSET